jgi:hypothetical protein
MTVQAHCKLASSEVQWGAASIVAASLCVQCLRSDHPSGCKKACSRETHTALCAVGGLHLIAFTDAPFCCCMLLVLVLTAAGVTGVTALTHGPGMPSAVQPAGGTMRSLVQRCCWVMSSSSCRATSI